MSVPSSNWSVAYECRKQWKVICFLMPAASIHFFNGFEIQAAFCNPAKTRSSSSSGRVPHMAYAWSEIGSYAPTFVFICEMSMRQLLLLVCDICFHFKFLISIWRKPVKIEKKEARLSTSLSQGVSANRFTSSRVSDARNLSSDGIPFTLALTSTVRYSSMKACFTPALTMAK